MMVTGDITELVSFKNALTKLSPANGEFLKNWFKDPYCDLEPVQIGLSEKHADMFKQFKAKAVELCCDNYHLILWCMQMEITVCYLTANLIPLMTKDTPLEMSFEILSPLPKLSEDPRGD